MSSAPIFGSAHEALVFATNFNHMIVPRSTMNQMMAPSTGSGGRGIGGLDGAAQAGMILAEVKRLPGILQGDVIYARVSPKSKACSCGRPCCSGKVPNWEYLETINRLASTIWDLQSRERESGKRGPVDNLRLRRALTLKYFGEGLSLAAIATDCDLNDNTVAAHNSFFARHLKNAEKEGWSAIDHVLREIGIVGEIEPH